MHLARGLVRAEHGVLPVSLSVLLPLAWLSLAIPSLWDWLFGTWTAYSQGHELLLLGVAAWLVWRQRDATSAGRPERLGAAFWLAWVLCLLGFRFPQRVM